MKQMKKYVWLVVSMLVMLLVTLEVMAAVPASPSIITMNGKQMRVQHRREDNTLKATTNYVIKGVGYSVACNWPVETYPPGAPFENDDRIWTWEMAKYDFPRIKEAGFNTIRLYVDLGMDTDSTLYYDEDTNGVIWDTTEAKIVAQDDDGDHQEDWLEGMPMVGQMSTVAVTQGLAVMDEAYKNGLKVIMVVDHFNNNLAVVQKLVPIYKNHPALLGWMIGNEFNYNFNDQGLYMWRYDTFQSACAAVNTTAVWIQANDVNHPVIACLGEPSVPSYSEYKTGVSAMTDIDILGINCYRGKSFKDLYEVMTDTISWNKPIFFSEYGVDAWHYNLDVGKEFEDLAGQKEGIAWQWDDIHNRLSAINANNTLLGGCVFDWVDEWWKYKGQSLQVHDNFPGYPVNAGQPPSTDLYPDGCMNEEWWGLNSQDTLSISTMTFYSDAGLLTESVSGVQGWDIYTWGLPVDGTGYGKINAQANYVQSGSPDNGIRYTYSPYPEYTYTGGTGAGNTIPEGTRAMYTELWSETYGVGWGLFRTMGYLDLSQYVGGNIKFWIKVKKADGSAIGTDESKIFLKFEDISGPPEAVFMWLDDDVNKNGGNTYFTEFNANSTAWQEITVPISALCDHHEYAIEHATIKKQANMDLSQMKMTFSLTCQAKSAGSADIQWWIDNVRWDMGTANVQYNRTARPALNDYRNKYNTSNYLKTVVEAGAVSDMNINTTRVAKNYSVVISTYGAAGSWVLSSAIDSKTGRITGMEYHANATTLSNWIDLYDNAGNDYILSFAKYGPCSFLNSTITKLSNIGATLYTTASSGPWAFITRVKDGTSTAKKESKGSNNIADLTLDVDLDTNSNGVTNICETDSDGDGLTDVQERRYGTDVLDTDTDDDGYSDSAEVSSNTNTRNPDSKVLSTDTQAVLRVKPLSLDFSNSELQAIYGGKERYLYIENDGGEYLSYKVDISYSQGSGWLAMKYRDHSTNAWTNMTTGSYLYKDLDDYMLQVVVDTATMTTQQTYNATVTITANDDDGTASGTQAINVRVPIGPILAISRTSVTATKPESSKKFQIKNAGSASFNWTITNIDPGTASWLTINPASGSTSSEIDDVTLSLSWTNFSADTHTVVKIDGGTAGMKFLRVDEHEVRMYDTSTYIDNVDASYLGLQPYDFRESTVGASADVDQDGNDDILVGALQYFTGLSRGKAYLFFGSKDNLRKHDTVASSVQFIGVGGDVDNTYYTGTAVALADVNGDGWKDVIIGDKCAYMDGDRASGFSTPTGAIYIFFNPMATVDAQGQRQIWKGTYGVSEADVIILGEEAFWTDFGDCMTSGDYNNDGYEDLVVGADNGGAYSWNYQAAFLIFGRSPADWNSYLANNFTFVSGLPHVYGGTHALPEVTRLYSGWNSTAPNNGWVGYTCSGDFDNDGYDDFVIGACEYPGWRRLYFLVYGRSGKTASWGTSLDCYNNLGANIIPITFDYNAAAAGPVVAGDVNGDSCYDIVVSTGSTYSYLLLGGTTKWTAAKYLPADATTKFAIPGDQGHPDLPWLTGLGIAKDMTGDGKQEIVVGAGHWWWFYQPLYIYQGRSTFPSSVVLDTDSNQKILSEGHNGGTWFCDGQLGVTASGDFNGDGLGDIAALAQTDCTYVGAGGQLYLILGKRLAVSSKTLLIGTTDTTGVFNVLNVSLDGQAIDWTASKNASWITSISPNSGTGLAAGQNTPVTVTINRTGLNDGVYTDDIAVTCQGRTEIIKLTMLVGPAERDPICGVSKEHVVVLANSDTVDITNIAPKSTMTWTAATSDSWITNISPNSGSISSGSTTLTITVNWSGYTTDQTGKITITYNNGCTKDIFVTMAKPKIRIGSTYYSTIQAAYNAATTGQTIQVQEGTFTETLTFNRAAIAVTIEGGYDNTWNNTTGKTTRIVGNVTESSSGGSVTFGSTGAVSIQ